jgi:DNA-binding beta-propeller fold protein YncE
MKKFYSAFVAACLITIWAGCSSKNGSPTTPGSGNGNPAPTPTLGLNYTPVPTFTCPSTGICASFNIERSSGQVSSLTLNGTVALNGAPVSNASVTLITPSGNVGVTFYSTDCVGGSCSDIYSYGGAWTYSPGGVYTLQVAAGGVSASAPVTVPGGITNAANGSQASWTVEGNRDYVEVTDFGSYEFLSGFPLSSDANSPVNIPVSIYSVPGDTYNFITVCVELVTNTTANSAIELFASDTLWTTLTPPTYTPTPSSPTPTPSPTSSPTITPTSTPTSTPSSTPTPIHHYSEQFDATISSSFYTIQDVALDSSNNLYVTGQSVTIVKLNSSGTVVAQWVDPGTYLSPVNPIGVAVDSSNNVWVVDNANSQVLKFNSGLTLQNHFGSPATTAGNFTNPTGIAVDPSNNIYVVDTGNHRVEKFNSSFAYQAQWGSNGTGNGQFTGAAWIAADSADVYVTDDLNGNIQKFTNTGTYVTQWALSGDRGIMVYTDGNIYLADTANPALRVFDTGGNYLNGFASVGSGNGQLSGPQGITHDAAGNIYVADQNNARVEVFGPN